MVTPQQEASAQCLQSAPAAVQDLNSRGDVPIIRHAKNSDQAREFNNQFRRVCDQVQDSGHQKDESVLRVALKWAMENSGSMEWNHHHEDIKWFFESFNLMLGSIAEFIHDVRERKYLVMSEAEWTSQATSSKRCLSSIVGPCRNDSSMHSSIVLVQEVWPLCLICFDSWSATASSEKCGRSRSAIQTCGAAFSAASASDGWFAACPVVICASRKRGW